MEQMKLYTQEEMLDKVLGKKGEPLRNKYEADMGSYLMRETIKKKIGNHEYALISELNVKIAILKTPLFCPKAMF